MFIQPPAIQRASHNRCVYGTFNTRVCREMCSYTEYGSYDIFRLLRSLVFWGVSLPASRRFIYARQRVPYAIAYHIGIINHAVAPSERASTTQRDLCEAASLGTQDTAVNMCVCECVCVHFPKSNCVRKCTHLSSEKSRHFTQIPRVHASKLHTCRRLTNNSHLTTTLFLYVQLI